MYFYKRYSFNKDVLLTSMMNNYLVSSRVSIGYFLKMYFKIVQGYLFALKVRTICILLKKSVTYGLIRIISRRLYDT